MSESVCEVCGYPLPLPWRNHQRPSDPNMVRCTGHAKDLCITVEGIKRSCPKLRGNPRLNPWAKTPSPCVGCDPREWGREPIIYYGDDDHQSFSVRPVRAWRIMKVSGQFVWTRADLYDPQPIRAVIAQERTA
jgi:hypothetical protein